MITRVQVVDKNLKHISYVLTRKSTQKELLELGIILVTKDPDLILLLQDNRAVTFDYWKKVAPIILWERNASSRIEFVDFAKDKAVRTYIKGQAILENIGDYNGEYQHGKLHYAWCYHTLPNSVQKSLEPIENKTIDQKVLDKLIVLYNDGVWKRILPYLKLPVNFKRNRSIDVEFVGVVSDPSKGVYYYHRVQALKAMHNLKKAAVFATSKSIKPPQYYNLMLDSKIVVSPWGYGEICFRDFEAILCGAILVKPDMSKVATWPNIFIPGKTYFPCKTDFSDLEEVVTSILDKWKELKEMRIATREVIVDAWKPESIAKRFADTVYRKQAG